MTTIDFIKKMSLEKRNLIRAKVHLISTDEFNKISNSKPEFKVDIRNDRKYQILSPELLQNILIYLLENRIDLDLRRGDLVCIESLLNSISRNSGKYIFNGIEIINLSFDADIYGNIPSEFQSIIEFPPRYWSKCIDHNLCVPFSYQKHLSYITTTNIICLSDQDKKSHFAIRFNSPTTSEESYIITYYTSPVLLDDPKIGISAQKLIKNIQNEIYFSYYDDEMKKYIPLPEQINPENVLIYDFKNMFI